LESNDLKHEFISEDTDSLATKVLQLITGILLV
jgi:hypothetical protein